MQTTILNISPTSNIDYGVALSFDPFIKYLKKRRDETTSQKAQFFGYVIDDFAKHPELSGNIEAETAEQYSEQLQLIYTTLTPILEDEDKQFWAMSMPMSPVLFFSTNAFFRLVSDAINSNIKSLTAKDPEAHYKRKFEMAYSLILEKCYHFPAFFSREFTEEIKDEKTGLVKYFTISMDTRFIDVHVKGELPKLSIADIQAAGVQSNDLLSLFKELLPLEKFVFEGFSILNAVEVTSQYAIENIKNILLNHSSLEDANYYMSFLDSLKTMVGSADVEFGLLPFLQVNNKLAFMDGACLNSALVNAAKTHDMVEMAYTSLADKYSKNPKLYFFRQITVEDEARNSYLSALKSSGIKSYALLPVFFNKQLVGVVEVYSKMENTLTDAMLAKIEPAMPLISQLLKNNIDEFNSGIDTVMKEKFTSLQPSVQWRFNEVAWHYMRDSNKGKERAELEDIFFEKVYPLYGAVDIRNSTVERNLALQKDLMTQFTTLQNVLQKLKDLSGFGLIDEKIFVCKKWIDTISNPNGFTEEIKLNNFLEFDIVPFLAEFQRGNPSYQEVTDVYFKSIDEKNGEAYKNRRLLENAMDTVISAVNNFFELMKVEIQQAYPCYFEKFRTDGVEYDIYIGQSIAPDRMYNDIYLKNLRLMQVTSMAAIAKYSHSLLTQLAKPVETTQLIFIHSNPIDVKFRQDEKRFDVEGAYNIRYHIIKKRIDKVRIKGTNERLTQPNKIALVYFSLKEAEEYITHINYLQADKTLLDDLEYLELEELQGVSGLRALRVGVNLD